MSEENKFEPMLGPQELFNGAPNDIVAVRLNDYQCLSYGYLTQEKLDALSVAELKAIPIVAMRRIIRTPTEVRTYSESKFEDELESIYWHFDSQRKVGSLSERDIFKGKVRYLFNQFMRPTKTPTKGE